MFITYKSTKEKRKLKIRKKVRKQPEHFRLSVYRSNQYSYAQIIDDFAKKTLVSASEKELSDTEKKLKKTERAHLVGQKLAEKAKAAKIEKVVFDRGSYRYLGRVKALADGAREGGLVF